MHNIYFRVKETKNISAKKHSLNKQYNEWRKIAWEAKEYKLKILNKIDEILASIEKIDTAFVAQLHVRIAYSVPNKEFKIAEKYFLKVVENEKLLTNQEDILETTYQGLGDLYFNTKQYDKASKIYIKLFDFKEIEDLIEEDILQMGIAMANLDKAKYLLKAEELLSFLYHLDVCDAEMDHLMATKTNYNLGLVKFKLKKNTEAKVYLKKALVLYKQRKWDSKSIYQLLNSIGDTVDSEPTSAHNP